MNGAISQVTSCERGAVRAAMPVRKAAVNRTDTATAVRGVECWSARLRTVRARANHSAAASASKAGGAVMALAARQRERSAVRGRLRAFAEIDEIGERQ